MDSIKKGSEWKKWDLHVHTASSFDHAYKNEDSYELLVNAWNKDGIQAVAITDHFLIDSKRIENIKKLAKGKITVFPGVELRTDKGGTNIHVILIFDENTSLKQLEEDFNAIMIRQKAKSSTNN